MKKAFVFVLLVLILAGTGWCYDLEKLLKESPDQRSYPGANLIILKDTIIYEVKEDDGRILTEHEAIKIFTEDGVDRFQTLNYNYNSELQEVEVEVARAITPDGEIIEVQKDGITDKNPLKKYAFFSNISTKTISFPRLFPGMIVEYKVKVIDKSGFMPYQFWNISYTQDFEPILETIFSVEVPRSWKFNYKAYGGLNLSPEVETVGNKMVYTWKQFNSPSIPREVASPPIADLAGQIIVSSLNSWNQFGNWYKAVLLPAITSSPDLHIKTKEIVRGKEPLESAKIIYSYIQENIKFYDFGWGEFGYVPHMPMDVFQNKYGNAQDIMTLALSMLYSAGVKAYPVLVCSRGYRHFRKEIPYPKQFDHCLVAMENEGELVFLDPTSFVAPFGELDPKFQGREAMILKEGGCEFAITPQSKAHQNREEISIEAIMDENGNLQQSVEIKEYGANSMAFRALLWNANKNLQSAVVKLIAKMISEGSQVLEGFIVNIKRIEEPLVITLGFICPQYAEVAPSSIYFKLPVFTSSKILDLVAKDYRERIFPLEVGAPAQIEKKMHINFPFKIEPVGLPAPLLIENKVGSYQLIYEISDKELWYFTRLIINDAVISREDYRAFKELVEAAFQVEREIVYLKKTI